MRLVSHAEIRNEAGRRRLHIETLLVLRETAEQMPPRKRARNIAFLYNRCRDRFNVHVEGGAFTRIVAGETARKRCILIERAAVLREQAAGVVAVRVFCGQTVFHEVAHKPERAHASGAVDHDLSLLVENVTAEGPQPRLEVRRH